MSHGAALCKRISHAVQEIQQTPRLSEDNVLSGIPSLHSAEGGGSEAGGWMRERDERGKKCGRKGKSVIFRSYSRREN